MVQSAGGVICWKRGMGSVAVAVWTVEIGPSDAFSDVVVEVPLPEGRDGKERGELSAFLDGRIGVYHLINRNARAVGERHLAHGIERHGARAGKAGQVGWSSPAPLASVFGTKESSNDELAPGVYLPPEAETPRSPPAVGCVASEPATTVGTNKLAPAGKPEYWTTIRVPVSAFKFCGGGLRAEGIGKSFRDTR